MTHKPHIHILGMGGTFMAGVATLAQQLGWYVTGSDKPLYPPMSDYLANKGLTPHAGYSSDNITQQPDCVVVGNAVGRSNPELEAILERKWPVMSGPAWLQQYVLRQRTVIAVAGTHGKTTTTSLIAWLLEANGLAPGYLIGGLANNFTDSARLGEGQYFVVEADEYDSAFFDKRSKFVHYWPDILVLNNLEFDHADIFDDLPAIQKQFQHLLRVVPGNGYIIVNAQSRALQQVIQKGCWSEVCYFNDPKGFHTELLNTNDVNNSLSSLHSTQSFSCSSSSSPHSSSPFPDSPSLFPRRLESSLDNHVNNRTSSSKTTACSSLNFTKFQDDVGAREMVNNQFVFKNGEQSLVTIRSPLWGEHNRCNMQAALLVSQRIGLSWQQCQQALETFQGVQRRLEWVWKGPNDIDIYQDFAHHPTAIQSTVAAMREKAPDQTLYVAIDFGSYTMRTGHHQAENFVQALQAADGVYLWAAPQTHYALLQLIQQQLGDKAVLDTDRQHLAQTIVRDCPASANLVLMSNRNFANMVEDLQNLMDVEV